MADQLRWWKLWSSALEDAALEALSLEDFARWCRLGAWLRLHGRGGTATLQRPTRALSGVLRHKRWGAILATLQRLPNVSVEVLKSGADGTPVMIQIRMLNWWKYQEDSSRDRTRKWRERRRLGDGPATVTRDVQPSVTRDGPRTVSVTEQTRRDGTPIVPSSPSEIDQHPQIAQQNPFGYPPGVSPESTRWTPSSRWPFAAFHHDCPDPKMRGHCVRPDYAASHDSYPVRANGAPRTCPDHQPE